MVILKMVSRDLRNIFFVTNTLGPPSKGPLIVENKPKNGIARF